MKKKIQHKQTEMNSEKNKYVNKKTTSISTETEPEKNLFFWSLKKAFLYFCDAIEHNSFFYITLFSLGLFYLQC